MMMQKEKTVGKAKTVGTLFSGNDLKKLIFPLIIEQILAVSVGMVDTMMVSSAGATGITATPTTATACSGRT